MDRSRHHAKDEMLRLPASEACQGVEKFKDVIARRNVPIEIEPSTLNDTLELPDQPG